MRGHGDREQEVVGAQAGARRKPVLPVPGLRLRGQVPPQLEGAPEGGAHAGRGQAVPVPVLWQGEFSLAVNVIESYAVSMSVSH